MSKRKRPSKRLSSSSDSESNDEYIYLIQPREFVRLNEPTFKVGRTSRGPYARSKEYSKDSVVWLMHKVSNSTPIETDILNKFKNKYQHMKNYGNEFFKGDNQDMIDDIREIIREYDKKEYVKKEEFDEKVYFETAKNGDLEIFEKQDKLMNQNIYRRETALTYAVENDRVNIVTYLRETHDYDIKYVIKYLNKEDYHKLDNYISNWNDALYGCSSRYFLEFLIEKGANDWNEILRISIVENYTAIIDYAIMKGADPLLGILTALKMNMIGVVNAIEKLKPINWILCVYNAIDYNFNTSNPIYKDSDSYFQRTGLWYDGIKKRERKCVCGKCKKLDEYNRVELLCDAIPWGKEAISDGYVVQYSLINTLKTIDYALSKDVALDLNQCIIRCIDSLEIGTDNISHKNVIKYLINNNESNNFNYFLLRACTKSFDLTELFIRKGANNFNECLLTTDSAYIAQTLIHAGATNFNEALLKHINDTYIAGLLLKAGATNMNEALLKACSRQNKAVVELLIKSGANNFNEALHSAIEVKSNELVRLLLDSGANDYSAALKFANENGHKFLADIMSMKLSNQ